MPVIASSVTMPVEQLSGEDGQPLPLVRSRPLSSDDIQALLRGGGVRFVFANVGPSACLDRRT
jgi:hypothetical protein